MCIYIYICMYMYIYIYYNYISFAMKSPFPGWPSGHLWFQGFLHHLRRVEHLDICSAMHMWFRCIFNQWMGFQGRPLQETHGSLPSKIGLSCKFSHHQILWFKWTSEISHWCRCLDAYFCCTNVIINAHVISCLCPPAVMGWGQGPCNGVYMTQLDQWLKNQLVLLILVDYIGIYSNNKCCNHLVLFKFTSFKRFIHRAGLFR